MSHLRDLREESSRVVEKHLEKKTARRKQKWSVDPRNSAWSNDDSKFGQKMLEKMGWSKGKGLGAQEQGNPEHIRVKVKNDVLGLGATINHEDNWIAHQDDFNQLLAELNNCHGQGETESSVKKQKKSFSLEEKSKSSKKRVHYMKFAKGKDLSSRTEQDLSCIFGRRQKSAKTQLRKEEEDDRENRSCRGIVGAFCAQVASASAFKDVSLVRILRREQGLVDLLECWNHEEMFQELELLYSGARLGELGVFTWRREGSRESSEPLPEPKGDPGELERDMG
ncbi:hypothetical protein HGM15179_013583 [Zosterops borbonicus]|uniref:G-patch domain-containing protein n=1 Tax=Zosterops borbonicus TaxID=364589 RepID=A0A8K1LH07_9PASS|nr:hypothetical protein HGM15179_013583 [Zosterops borbonicus]